jgi:HEPN domain-containing protein
MPERSKDWLNQAKWDLKSAQKLFEAGIFEWACFAAQQSAEKAVKAVLQRLNAVAWGHSVSVLDLLRILSRRIEVSQELLDCAKILDKYYVATRYPNSFESGSPYEYFTEKEAENAVFCGRRIIEFCEGILVGTR